MKSFAVAALSRNLSHRTAEVSLHLSHALKHTPMLQVSLAQVVMSRKTVRLILGLRVEVNCFSLCHLLYLRAT